MNKLLAVLVAGAFALGSVAAVAQVPAGDKTSTPTTPEEQAKMKAERDKLRAERAKMTPEEKAAAKKVSRKKRQQEITQIEKQGQPQAPVKAEALKKNVEATKNDPKALPDAKARREALKEQEKKAGAGQ
jgi:hypothetical protein